MNVRDDVSGCAIIVSGCAIIVTGLFRIGHDLKNK